MEFRDFRYCSLTAECFCLLFSVNNPCKVDDFVRMVVRAFYPVEYVVVMDALVRRKAM